MADLKPGTEAGTTTSMEPGLHVVSLRRLDCVEHFITAAALEGEEPGVVVNRALQAVRDRSSQIVSIENLGLPFPDDMRDIPYPITTLGGKTENAGGGVQIWAVQGPPVTTIPSEGSVVGATFGDAFARYARLGGVMPSAITAARATQAADALRQMDAALRSADFQFQHTLRTWFYNHDILEWYDEFNRTRDKFFEEKGVFDRLIPASTGTGGGNLRRAALSAGLLAIKPHDKRVRIRAVPSPLQCAALEYGSSFSRAIEVQFPDHKRLFVSGTASIDQNGDTAYPNEFEAQAQLTFEVVRAILVSRGMDWADVSRGIAYVKRVSDVPAFEQYCACGGLAHLPLVTVNVDICRDDLLFELEVDAITVKLHNHE